MELVIVNQLTFGQDFGLMKRAHAVKTLSLPHDVLRKGMERAALFKMKFSHYIGLLIERDYASGTRQIVIVADEPKPGAGYTKGTQSVRSQRDRVLETQDNSGTNSQAFDSAAIHRTRWSSHAILKASQGVGL